ncbi:CRISPR-associated protein Cas5 [Thermosulfidibacter takaii ABI70S6]|uniref:CRISPR-associated protein Cas5 n=1 Tax=Thermosulfidibacter takaii (strain DSM 17441 / JCM 13301 / NBRC 103674 / ABI70S6) TaxID=1298851 RepID=A0A0S3QU19_THET7|nr:CRISPR-associated protein Cas5 [Thermosulfidibacter takaii]BAT71826.1 CRISPR-associated protein Cas5 [Thermosulfidibacter takaii ABI70S6]
MQRILALEIFQPFAQYRNPFTFYYAQTYPLPPKSAIIGMLQNATNCFYDENFWNLKVSVHGGFESTFWNYQNLIKATKTGIVLKKYQDKLTLFNQGYPLYGEGQTSQRSPVNQQELFNGHLFIFIKGPTELISKIKVALKKPRKILYLGRSEDIVFIRKVWTQDELENSRKDIKSFFILQFPTYIRLKSENGREFPISKDKYPVYSIGTYVRFVNNGKPIRNRVEIVLGVTERESKFATVIYAGNDSPIILKESLSIESYKTGNKIFKIPEDFGWL